MLKRFNKAKDWVKNKKGKLPRIKNFRTLTMCDKCYAFYYKNSWNFQRPTYLNDFSEEEVPVFFTQCSACLEQENSLYETESSFA